MQWWERTPSLNRMVGKFVEESILGVSQKVCFDEFKIDLEYDSIFFFFILFLNFGATHVRFYSTVENLEHCDFIALRNMVIRTHLQDLKDVTNNVHYENFRCRTLAGVGVDGKPTKVSNR